MPEKPEEFIENKKPDEPEMIEGTEAQERFKEAVKRLFPNQPEQ